MTAPAIEGQFGNDVIYGDDGNDDSENEKMHAPEDYKKGWDAALAAIKANKIDPNTF